MLPSSVRRRQLTSRRSAVLLLAALMAVFVLPSFAAAASSPAPAAAADASFVAALAAPAPTPAPIFVQTTSCATNADCPTGQLCCLACGYFGCTRKACFQPMNGHCPLFP
jgi:hypothetical protein